MNPALKNRLSHRLSQMEPSERDGLFRRAERLVAEVEARGVASGDGTSVALPLRFDLTRLFRKRSGVETMVFRIMLEEGIDEDCQN